MERLRVGVVRGGISSEYDVSLRTGASVLKNLPTDKYEPYDILITKNGVWHFQGIPFHPETLPDRVDVVFNALHGFFGEDGKIQKFFDSIDMPYTGSGHFASAVSMNKNTAKDYFTRAGLKTPLGVEYSRETGDVDSFVRDVFNRVSPPWVIKPMDGGSSVGISIAKDFDELRAGISEALRYSDTVLVEEKISGREATCGVVDSFRDRDVYPLFPIEIRSRGDHIFFNYDAKYDGLTEEICPGNFSDDEKKEIERMSEIAHKELGLSHYSRSDFIVSTRGIYILETNTLPGLTQNSLLPKALSAVGFSYGDFLDHVIELAIK